MHSLQLLHAFCASITVTALISSSAYSAVITFNGGVPDNSWSNGVNWSSGSPPTAVDLALITNGLQAAEVNSAGAVSRNIDVRDGGVLNVTGGDLTFGLSNNRWLWVGFQTPGTVNQSGGTVTGIGNNTDLVVDQFGTYNMTGGTLDLPDDVWMLDGSQFIVGGQSTIHIADDFRIMPFVDTTFQINLVGDQEPTIVIDDLFMLGGLHVEVDTSAWTGGSEFTLFQVNDNIVGELASLTIDGVARDPDSIQFDDGALVVHMNEPASGVLAGIALFWMVLLSPVRRRLFKRRSTPPSTALQGMHTPPAAAGANSIQTIPAPASRSTHRRKPISLR